MTRAKSFICFIRDNLFISDCKFNCFSLNDHVFPFLFRVISQLIGWVGKGYSEGESQNGKEKACAAKMKAHKNKMKARRNEMKAHKKRQRVEALHEASPA